MCLHYQDLGIIFGDDIATGDRAVSGNDFPPMNENDASENIEVNLDNENEADENVTTEASPSITSKRTLQGTNSKVRRKRRQPVDDASAALSVIADSSKKIAVALEMQAVAFEKQATQTHVNWKVILDKLKAMHIEKTDIMQLMKVFEQDKELGRIFIDLDDDEFARSWIVDKLG